MSANMCVYVCVCVCVVCVLFALEMRSHYVAQAGLGLLGSSNPSASASQSAGIIVMSHRTQSRTISYAITGY